LGGAAGGRWDAGRSRARLKGGRPGLGVRVQEGISPEIAARRVSERRGEERDDRRGRVAVRQERERANRVRASVLSCGPGAEENGSTWAIGLAGTAVLGRGREVGRGGVLGRSEIGRRVKRPSGRALLGCGG